MKRFEPDAKYIGSGDYVGRMIEEDSGEYVLFADHEAAVQRERQAAAASALREAAASLRITADVVGEEKHRMSREAETYRYAAKMIDERAERADKETT